jgi:hypothetical protein
VVILVYWRIWTFQQEFSMVERVFELIIEDIKTWKAAGCK